VEFQQWNSTFFLINSFLQDSLFHVFLHMMHIVKGGVKMNNNNNFFKNIEKKTGVNMNEVLELANSLQNANFQDEKTVRNVIKKVSRIANKPVSKEVEDKIVKSIVNDGKQLDFGTISNMLNKGKK
jgi:pantothenate synthetase